MMTASAPIDQTVISAHGITKMFKIYQQSRDLLQELLTGRDRHKSFWALKGVSFTVNRGEVVGIMGRNGAGKSTLLKILAGTLTPTDGTVAINGRVSAILELGSGFNPNFTGRENVYMGGLCAGFKRSEIDEKFDEIVDFAELGAVIDQPFRTYSTGMQARLSFSTVMVADPEVLIVDEALAVGDARFQLKCFDRFQRLRARGKTVLLVTHSAEAITACCDRAILLDGGAVVSDSDPNTVTKIYHQLLFGTTLSQSRAEPTPATPAPHAPPTAPLTVQASTGAEPTDPTRYGDKRVVLETISLADDAGHPVGAVETGKRHRLICQARIKGDVASLCLGVHIRDRRGFELFGCDTITVCGKGTVPIPPVGGTVVFDLSLDMHMGGGVYFLTVGLAEEDGTKLDMWFDALQFKVLATPKLYHASKLNLYPEFTIKTQEIM